MLMPPHIFEILQTGIVFFAVLSLLVFIHELGHFTVAKWLGVEVQEFGFGLPPRMWGKKVGETIYSINWLPIGGFVKLLGEDEDQRLASSVKRLEDRKRLFFTRSKKERAAVLLAGVSMNFILAVIIISYVFTQGVLVPSGKVVIDRLADGAPAQVAGLRSGDVVAAVDGVAVHESRELIEAVGRKKGQLVEFSIVRDGQQLTFSITPRTDYPSTEGPLGIAINSTVERKYPWYQAPFFGLAEALKMSFTMIATLGDMLWRLVTFQKISADIAGPLGIAQVTGQAVRSGWRAVIELTGLLSLNLALVNILPIPALDGGRLLFVVLEKIIGKKVKPRAEAIAHQFGMAFLLGLILLVTINDILRIVRG